MHDFQRPWWVAGGWAVDMFLGSITRSQSDVDIAVLRADQDMLWRYLQRRRHRECPEPRCRVMPPKVRDILKQLTDDGWFVVTTREAIAS
jgi:hypothetical protein